MPGGITLHLPQFVRREGSSFYFTPKEGTGDVQACLAALGVSKTLSGRLRAQQRACIDADTGELCIDASVEPVSPHTPSQEPLRVLYEDDFIIAAEKPSGLLVHGDGTHADTLTGRVEDYLAAGEGVLSPQAVQRLDVETTGVVLFSKAVEFQGLFDALVADHALMEKRYLAVVEGGYPKARDRINAALARDRHDARRMRTCAPGQGQDALTYVERLAVSLDGSHSLLLVTLGTGRKHQIRVHLASRGFPVVGDTLYGRRGAEQAPLMLHAWRESFTHPLTGEGVCIESSGYERFAAYVPQIETLLKGR